MGTDVYTRSLGEGVLSLLAHGFFGISLEPGVGSR
jgi:hypothetical protein